MATSCTFGQDSTIQNYLWARMPFFISEVVENGWKVLRSGQYNGPLLFVSDSRQAASKRSLLVLKGMGLIYIGKWEFVYLHVVFQLEYFIEFCEYCRIDSYLAYLYHNNEA